MPKMSQAVCLRERWSEMSAFEAKDENRNPWKDQSTLPRVRRADAVLAFLALALCSFALACVRDDLIALITLPVLFLYVVLRVRTPGVVLVILACPFVGYLLSGGANISRQSCFVIRSASVVRSPLSSSGTV